MTETYSDLDSAFMRRALQLAQQAANQGEVPVGAVLVRNGEVLGEASNAPIATNDATAHAEISAIRQAGQSCANYRLPNSTLYVTLEPCAMCAGAIVHARVERVVIATREPRAGAAGSIVDLLNHPDLNHRCVVEVGLHQQQSADLLKAFFKSRR